MAEGGLLPASAVGPMVVVCARSSIPKNINVLQKRYLPFGISRRKKTKVLANGRFEDCGKTLRPPQNGLSLMRSENHGGSGFVKQIRVHDKRGWHDATAKMHTPQFHSDKTWNHGSSDLVMQTRVHDTRGWHETITKM